MKEKYLLIVIVLALLFMTTAAILAQSSGNFNLGWHVVGSGSGESASAHYKMQGTTGQTFAGPPKSNSSSFIINSGFWLGSRDSDNGGTAVYMPAILRN
jgi:hypothetical protein